LDRDIPVDAPHLGARRAHARGIDLSEGGIGVELNREVALGDRILFELEHEGDRLRLEAEVRSVRQKGGEDRLQIGLCWVGLDERRSRELSLAVDRLRDALRRAKGAERRKVVKVPVLRPDLG